MRIQFLRATDMIKCYFDAIGLTYARSYAEARENLVRIQEV